MSASGERARNKRQSRGLGRPFAAYYRSWLEVHARVYCKPGTVAGYEAAGRLYLVPFFGDADIRRITPEQVRALVYERLLPGHAFATVRANIAPLRAMLNQAVADGILDSNPAAGVLRRARGRRVDLSRQLVETLRVVRAEQQVAAGGRASEWIFASTVGVAPNTDNFRRRAWRRIVRGAGLDYVWPHCLRHTFASLLLANGESLAYVKEQLGHRSIQTTVDIYGHLTISRNRAAVNRLDD